MPCFADELAGPRASEITRAEAQAAQANAAYEQLRLSGGPQMSAAIAQVRASDAQLRQAQSMPESPLARRAASANCTRAEPSLCRQPTAPRQPPGPRVRRWEPPERCSTPRKLRLRRSNKPTCRNRRKRRSRPIAATAQATTIRAGTRPDQIKARGHKHSRRALTRISQWPNLRNAPCGRRPTAS